MRGGVAAIGVVIADDHPIFRSGLAHEIKRDSRLELLGEAADGRLAMRLIKELRPTVAVIDMRMPGLPGVHVTEAIRQLGLPTRVLVLSAFDEPQGVFDSFAAGASGYVLKDVDRSTICDAIARVSRGEHVLPEQLHGGLLDELHQRRAHPPPQLSAREHAVLELAARGLSTPQSAAACTSARAP